MAPVSATLGSQLGSPILVESRDGDQDTATRASHLAVSLESL
ncbi:hypothetical protein CORC01_03183 [Colletotrichum orchidophilum]|uniref:Uncharacterized protein n=1 Tax=Colletotrichum orchidophilum TaxID=1209926 RepID=A0A1G4BJG2_9PEZI|nr:uncharacterized protein CORC01_03183 [Colletotrichum orchidophilum]OHF01427.1 hypothetical protein CORC01_03183 [Colletotrichum orchidophilum]